MLTFGEVLQPEKRDGCSPGSQLPHQLGRGPPAGCPGGHPQPPPLHLGSEGGMEAPRGWGGGAWGGARATPKGRGGRHLPLQGNLLPDHFVEALPVLGRGALLTGHREQSAGHGLVVKLRHRDRRRSPPGPGPGTRCGPGADPPRGPKDTHRHPSLPESSLHTQTLCATRGSECAPGAAATLREDHPGWAASVTTPSGSHVKAGRKKTRHAHFDRCHLSQYTSFSLI